MKRKITYEKFGFVLFALTIFFGNANSVHAECIDTKPYGDGWGWDGEKGCQVTVVDVSHTEAVQDNACPPESDHDGDGWGWDGEKGCQVTVVDVSHTEAVQDNACPPESDHDGDGWGWDGEKGCQVTVVDVSHAEAVEGNACPPESDHDGDGWGWDGEKGCQVTVVDVEESTTEPKIFVSFNAKYPFVAKDEYFTFSADWAAKYATENVFKQYGSENPFQDYSSYEPGGNCTNFVSQALIAGFIKSSSANEVYQNRNFFQIDRECYAKTGSCPAWFFQSDAIRGPAWAGANEMYGYAKQNKSSYEGLHFKYVTHDTTSDFMDYNAVQKGDIIFADLNDEIEGIEHAMIVTEINKWSRGYNKIRVTYQSYDTLNKKLGDINEDSNYKALFYVYRPLDYDPKKSSTTYPIYRFWSDSKKSHFYTRSLEEKNYLIAFDASWQYEMIAFNALGQSYSSSKPVYRFWSENFRSHFYTISENEKTATINDPNWAYEGVAYHAFSSWAVGRTALYRFWSENFRSHFFTTSKEERDGIIANNSDWIYEGIAYYVQ